MSDKGSFTPKFVAHIAACGSLMAVETGKYSLKRTSTVDPGVSECGITSLTFRGGN